MLLFEPVFILRSSVNLVPTLTVPPLDGAPACGTKWAYASCVSGACGLDAGALEWGCAEATPARQKPTSSAAKDNRANMKGRLVGWDDDMRYPRCSLVASCDDPRDPAS